MITDKPEISTGHDLMDTSQLQFQDLFDLEESQRLQDAFSSATGVSSLITDPSGHPITRPSNFTEVCSIIRDKPAGLARCMHSDAVLG